MTSSSGTVRKRPVITVMEARPMSEVGFRDIKIENSSNTPSAVSPSLARNAYGTSQDQSRSPVLPHKPAIPAKPVSSLNSGVRQKLHTSTESSSINQSKFSVSTKLSTMVGNFEKSCEPSPCSLATGGCSKTYSTARKGVDPLEFSKPHNNLFMEEQQNNIEIPQVKQRSVKIPPKPTVLKPPAVPPHRSAVCKTPQQPEHYSGKTDDVTPRISKVTSSYNKLTHNSEHIEPPLPVRNSSLTEKDGNVNRSEEFGLNAEPAELDRLYNCPIDVMDNSTEFNNCENASFPSISPLGKGDVISQKLKISLKPTVIRHAKKESSSDKIDAEQPPKDFNPAKIHDKPLPPAPVKRAVLKPTIIGKAKNSSVEDSSSVIRSPKNEDLVSHQLVDLSLVATDAERQETEALRLSEHNLCMSEADQQHVQKPPSLRYQYDQSLECKRAAAAPQNDNEVNEFKEKEYSSRNKVRPPRPSTKPRRPKSMPAFEPSSEKNIEPVVGVLIDFDSSPQNEKSSFDDHQVKVESGKNATSSDVSKKISLNKNRTDENKWVPPKPPPPPKQVAQKTEVSSTCSDKTAAVRAVETTSNSVSSCLHPNSASRSKAPGLPSRPGPGHPLYHYTVTGPHGIALYDFKGEKAEDLTVQAGDVIVLLGCVDTQWLWGRNVDKEGMFPEAFIEIIEPLPDNAPIVKPSSHSIGTDSSNAHSAASSASGSGPHCVARFDYESNAEGDLNFRTGETITLIEHVGVDWLRGSKGTEVGLFPAAFVEIIVDVEDHAEIMEKEGPVTTSLKDSDDHSLKGLSSFCTALYDFCGQSSAELDFKIGDRIEILSQINDEWLHGRLKNTEGLFPKAFVDEIKEEQNHRGGNVDIQHTADDSEFAADSSTTQGLTAVKALYDFNGQTDGDLSFQKGDTIHLLEQLGEDWMRGMLGNQTGIFPSSFVEILVPLPS